MIKKLSKNKNKYNSGITILELLVVISILIIISGITIFNYSKFKSSTTLQNLADDVALSVRRVQGYAIGVRGYNDNFNSAYGIHFTTNPTNSGFEGSNKSIVLFVDVNDDGKYESGDKCGTPDLSNECLEVLNITSSDQVANVYINRGRDDILVSKGSSVDILFKRPNPEPYFCYNTVDGYSSDCTAMGSDVSFVKIEISNPQSYDVYKTIIIHNNGQISIS